MTSNHAFGRAGRSSMSFVSTICILIAWALPAISLAALPEARVETEYLAQKYQIDGLTTRWLTETDTQAIAEPTQNDEQTIEYAEEGWFDLAARAGYVSGLGARSVAYLPPIDTSGQTWEIRSNALVVSRMVKHIQADSADGNDMAIDLLLFAEGNLGYASVGDEADPYAFERILDAGISLEVNVYRESGAVRRVWAGGANLVRSEDIELDFSTYGDLGPEHWNVYDNPAMGRTAELVLPEAFEALFTVSDGEIFAVEYVVTLSTRNYEYPNWRSFAEFYDSFNFKLSPSERAATNLDEQLRDTLEEIYSESLPSVAVPAKSYAYSRVENRNGQVLDQLVTSPPWIFPTSGNSWSDAVVTNEAEVRFSVRDRATFNPFGGGGNLGAQAAISIDHKTQTPPFEPISGEMVATPSFLSFFIPMYDENNPPESIDVDFNLALNGTLEYVATDGEGFQALVNSALDEPSYARIRVKGIIHTPSSTYSLGFNSIEFRGEAIDSPTGLTPDEFRFVRIPENTELPQEGGRIEINIDSQTWSPDHPLYSNINDIVTITPGEWVAIWYRLEAHAWLDGTQLEHLKRLESDFFKSLKPSLSSNTPGVRFVPTGPNGPVNTQVIESTLKPGQSAAFYDPDRNGEGLFVELLDGGVAVVYMFTYDQASDEQVWLLGVGQQMDDSIIVEQLLRPTGPAFGPGFNPADVVYNDFGTLSFKLPTCGSSEVAGSLFVEPGNGTGFEWLSNFNYRQLGVIADCETGATSEKGPLSGSWYDPTHDGEGIILEVLDNGIAVAQWFTYDANGEQFWIQGTGAFDGQTLVVDNLFSTRGTRWGSGFDAANVESTPWGTLTMAFSGCGLATVNYESTLPAVGSGTLNMQRLTNLKGIQCTE